MLDGDWQPGSFWPSSLAGGKKNEECGMRYSFILFNRAGDGNLLIVGDG